MTFKEKLEKLISASGKTRAQIARESRLNPAVLNNYINRGSEPMAKAAGQLAKALGAPLGWLIDDGQDWPPPPPARNPTESPSDGAVAAEFRGRLLYIALRMRDALRHAEKQDWRTAATKLAELPVGEKVPSELAGLLDVEHGLEGVRYQLDQFNVELEGHEFWRNRPEIGPDNGDELAIQELVKRHRDLASRGDYGKFRRLVLLRLLDTSMPGAAEKVDRERRQLLDELRNKKK